MGNKLNEEQGAELESWADNTGEYAQADEDKGNEGSLLLGRQGRQAERRLCFYYMRGKVSKVQDGISPVQ